MTTELGVMDGWLYSTLTADGEIATMVGGRVYDALAPRGAALPYIVFQLQAAAGDTVVVGGIRLAANALYAVRAVTQGHGYAGARAIAAQVDRVLHGRRAVQEGGVVLSCHRERPLKLPPGIAEGGAVYYQEGGIYRLRVRVT
ncbi:MAG: DUF3168 domain-containing protein [Chloroflexi bacterium]|nr:DUF3168 domain-containing protein [Chloroflexota bacterium]